MIGPPAAVLAEFGVSPELLEPLPGGRGLTWRAGPIVLRPGGDHAESEWKASVLADLAHTDAFRTPRPVPPVRGRDHGWTREGWEAWEWLPGSADESRLRDVVHAGGAFHRALAGVARPEFIARVDDPWSLADRAAWGERPLPADPLLDALAGRFAPVASSSQLVHGDLLGNVLFSPGDAPAIIDWAPYWRPPGLGAAIAAVDAACWHGFPVASLAELADIGPAVGAPREWPQLLVRALVFRMATLHLLGLWDAAHAARHGPVVRAVIGTLNS
jgi:uncharacterized protein (TIGR02569 family)